MDENATSKESNQPLLCQSEENPKADEGQQIVQTGINKVDDDDFQQAPHQESDEATTTTPAPLLNNRKKAVIFANIFAVTLFTYTTLLKITINEKDVDPLDICLVRVMVMFVGTILIAKCMKQNFYVEPKDRKILMMRSIAGTIGFTSLTYGVALVPLVVQTTIFNTAPFWASFLGWIFLRESITNFEIVAMIFSFGGVCLIATSNSILGTDEDAQTGEITDRDEAQIMTSGQQVLGSGLVFLTSWCYASVSILTRQMQKLNFAIMLFYYSILAFFATLIVILVQSWITGTALTLFSYNGEQWGYTLLVSTINFIGLNCNVIALQNERSGFITLLGYIGLVYATLGDIFIFNIKLQWLQLVGITIVVCLNVALICKKNVQPVVVPAADKETPSQDKQALTA